ncbi:uncharacterized protein BO80DRAFT_200025 [Aspergillus ibericus CBS 121593]|uniref:Uncharacterized protein n=1 Tax=Aspergillus ibericus CBS 121593 TaxID=1448316 RepID=A0A395GNS7_9EURO|nr:hypothetical protein BO80DRAFT_200025 [Aspergillus ibericus CBS 121593]RAK97012.1 hypothetical protein BO80DRAFT_200025 [Aspergillus ibericus CBS 121593]
MDNASPELPCIWCIPMGQAGKDLSRWRAGWLRCFSSLLTIIAHRSHRLDPARSTDWNCLHCTGSRSPLRAPIIHSLPSPFDSVALYLPHCFFAQPRHLSGTRPYPVIVICLRPRGPDLLSCFDTPIGHVPPSRPWGYEPKRLTLATWHLK